VRHAGFTQHNAEVLALQAVAYLASDDERVAKFVATTGLNADCLRQSINDAAVLAGVLDYVLADETLLVAFCEHIGVAPETPALARLALPGSEQFQVR